jgi:hypothetical protein
MIMTSLTRTATPALLALGLGFLGGGALLGRATAQQPMYAPPPMAPPARYQYQCLTQMNPRIWSPEVQQRLNQLGAEGWRLLEPRYAMPGPTSYMDVYCFERRF